jgi:hypothetical protein
MTKALKKLSETNITEPPVDEESTVNYAQTGLNDYNKPLEEKENEPVKSQFQLYLDDVNQLADRIEVGWKAVKIRLGGDEQLVFNKADLKEVKNVFGPVKDLVETHNRLIKIAGDIENYNNNPLI